MLLLDTHVFIWMSLSSPDLKTHIGDAIDRSAKDDGVFVSPITFWEVGMLESKRRLALDRPLEDWVVEVLAKPGIALTPLSAEIAVGSSRLPGEFPPDPADRMIVATARAIGATLVTHDRAILRYGADGHVDVMAA